MFSNAIFRTVALNKITITFELSWRRSVQWCSGKYLFGGTHGERGAQAYNEGLGAAPPAESRVRALGGGQGGEAPLKLKRFYVLDMQWKQQTCLTTLCILETE